MNRGEANRILRALKAKGAAVVEAPASADVMLLATCVVIEKTERKVLRRLAYLRTFDRPIAVTGCATSVCRGKIAEVSDSRGLFLPGDVESPVNWLDAESRKLGALSCRPALEAATRAKPAASRAEGVPFTTDGDIVCPIPIASGCLGSCSYCITRLARGELRSRTLSEITKEANNAIEAGAAELQLCAQDAGVYGKDIGTSLASLVHAIVSLEGDFMVRVGMMNPASVADSFQEILDAFDSPKIFKFFHMSIQSGCDSLLEKMGRRHGAAEALGMMKSFRRRFLDSTISTDVIVAFPGESAEAHEATKRFLIAAEPDIVNVTRFSPRPGTPAASMEGAPHGRTAKARSRELMALRMKLATENNRRWVGHTIEAVAVEKGKPGTTLARTDGYRQVVIMDEVSLGMRYNVHIHSATSINVYGNIVHKGQKVTREHS